jgi:hypothetical protein
MFANNDLLVLTPPLAIFVLAVILIVAWLANDLSAFCSGKLAPIHSLHCLAAQTCCPWRSSIATHYCSAAASTC